MKKNGGCVHLSIGYIALLLIFASLFSNTAYAQDLIPYQLSEAVQAQAMNLNIWNQIIRENMGNPIIAYLNELTAADIMAKRRAEVLRKGVVENSDYNIMFASWCRFIPNKPPLPNFSNISGIIRNEILKSRLYIDNSQRLKLNKAMHGVLLEGKIDTLYSILKKVNNIDEFNKQVFDSAVLVK